MDEIFDSHERIPSEQLKQLNRRSDGPALLRFGVQYALFWASAVFLVVGKDPWLWSVALVVFALMVMPFFALTHETSHRTAFETRWLNGLVGWLVSTPIFYTPTGFRQFHWAHHRYTNDPLRDPEVSLGGKPAPELTSRLFFYVGFLSGLPFLFYKVALLVAASLGAPAVVWERFLFFVSDEYKRTLSWEARVTLLFHVGWIGLGIVWWPALLWLLVGQILGHSFLSLCLITEHNGRPHTGSIFERTRTTLASPFVKFLMWNMPYHAEHHAYPSVPWHALPQLHEVLKNDLKRVSPSYPKFHAKALSTLAQGQPYRESEEM